MSKPIYQLKDFIHQNDYHIAKHSQKSHLLHFHDCIEISILEKGTGIQVINGTEYLMPKYSFSIMNYSDCHAFYDLSNDNIIYNLMIWPNLLSISNLTKLEKIKTNKICFLTEMIGKSVISILDTLFYFSKSNHFYPVEFIKPFCNSLIDIFFYNYSPKLKQKPANESKLQNALEYINLHFKEDISLNDIANYTKYNPTHLSERFHKKLGVTLKYYISSLRINYAKQLLLSTTNSIIYICFDCGFSSVASFNRNFLNIVKMTPSSYKKSISNSNLYNRN